VGEISSLSCGNLETHRSTVLPEIPFCVDSATLKVVLNTVLLLRIDPDESEAVLAGVSYSILWKILVQWYFPNITTTLREVEQIVA
jgi:hypothetical protein